MHEHSITISGEGAEISNRLVFLNEETSDFRLKERQCIALAGRHNQKAIPLVRVRLLTPKITVLEDAIGEAKLDLIGLIVILTDDKPRHALSDRDANHACHSGD